ncbi:YeeE/YedE family protein [Chondromyces crocatus]|uniref:Membrane protein n=1 Tax=Chondromyces crocatus TaxID=52 RepID=A0A0K1EA23_CHOCO|nr:YeeE/YedE family protein [Chondromyces crocatus]AKT37532.1 membrane protein [Chondromyces crocatus]
MTPAQPLARLLAALASGLLFGLGLSLSGMLDPARVRGFLAIAPGWDPSLMFVLGGAVTVSALGYQLARRLSQPAFDRTFHLPTRTTIDRKLVLGSALFGLGWGLAGLCPGPAVASLVLGLRPTLLFVGTMLLGMLVHAFLFERTDAPKPSSDAKPPASDPALRAE